MNKNVVNSHVVWSWCRVIGSIAVFVAVACLFWSVNWSSVGGAYELVADNDLHMSVALSSVWSYFHTNFSMLLPVTSMVEYLFSGIDAQGAVLLSTAFALDMVLWFNVLLIVLEMVLFLPLWFLGWMEKVVKNGRRY